MSFTRLLVMISKFVEDPAFCAILCDSVDRRSFPGKKPMVGPADDTRGEHSAGLEAKPFPAPQSTARRCLHQPCPGCGSRMVRARDLRDMCVVCGYLQSQA
jgi:hypothetical protein